MGRCAGLLRLPGRRRPAAVRGGADHGRRPGGVGDDARLPRLRRRRRTAHPVPDLAQHQHRGRRRAAERTVRLQHPAPLEHRAPVPGGPGQRGPRRADRAPHHPRRLRALAADRRAGARHRRRQRHVPDRHPHRRLRRRHGRHVRRPGRRTRPDLRLADLLPDDPPGRRPGRHADRRRGPAARPVRHAAAGRSGVPARGRRRHRDGGHQLGRAAHRQRQRRHQHLRDGRARARAQPGAPRAGPGHHPGRRPGGDGALQQRRQRAQRLGRPVRRVRRRRRRRRRHRRRSSRRCSAPRWTARRTAAG